MNDPADLQESLDEGLRAVATKTGPIGIILILLAVSALLDILIFGSLWVLT